MSDGSDPSMRQLRLLLVLAEELHFGRAAERLYISQPALSRQLRRLEEQWGVALLERSTRRVRLTAAGEALLPRVREAVGAAEALRNAVREQERSLSGRLVLGCYVTALPVIRALLERVEERHPGLETALREVDFTEQFGALLDGRVDAVLCYGPAPRGVQSLRLATEPVVACLTDGHRLAGRRSVTLAELARVPVVGLSPAVPDGWRAFWAADPRPDGAPVAYTAHTATTFEGGLAAVAQGAGLRLVSASCRELFPRPGIRYVDVSDAPPCAALLAWAAARRDAPGVVALRRAATELAAQAAGDGPDARWWDGSAGGTAGQPA
ncbi:MULTISPECIES: LysR family transcriptional regulator [Streptomyces]|uniref:LysR substrate-binding domain-containing protein n=1 Tax=Streptomyces chengmaiensis TaxID=3040919 RepID=A0ABT6HJ93_9ACTN|nr:MULTISPECIES: LysR substrate-binding domain-containing protein [Streptomyces]MDH2387949.1 LysR substrate-binding domain-containing protein [Streptomyces chengmaiensis]WRQ79867.1 LysR substrate-binding domain-containing protein [Streptomyces sp. MUM 178J]